MQRRALLFLGGIIAAIAAAMFTLYAFDITTPPRDIEALLRPSPTHTTVVAALPTGTPPPPTGTPVPKNLIYTANLTQPGEWPTTSAARYTKTGYQLTTPANSDFQMVPLAGFADTAKTDIKIITAGTPVDSTSVEYGVFFWHSVDPQGRERFLALTISSQRTFRLRAYGPATDAPSDKTMRWTDLVPTTGAPNILTDGRANRIEVELHPGQIRVTLNGSEMLDREREDIDAYREQKGFDGRLGLIAIAAPKAEARAEFTLFELYNAPLPK